jgi:hypothetical protein
MRRTPFRLALVASAVLAAALLAAACGGSGGMGGGSGVSGGGTTTSFDLFGGNTGSVVAELATKLGCSNFSADNHLDNHANEQGSCRFHDTTLLLYGFGDSGAQQAWLAAGPQTADNSGTVILGDKWAISLFDPSQADAVEALVGGSLRHMG